MKTQYIVGNCSKGLHRMMMGMFDVAQQSTTLARLLALPLGLLLGLSIPFIRIAGFVENFFLFLINLIKAPFSSEYSIKDAGDCLKSAFKEIAGILLSPFMAIFVSTAFITSVIVNPRGAIEKFALTCKSRQEQCQTHRECA